MIYLSGASNERVRALAQTHPVGLLAQPGNSLHLQISAFRWWAADNGCFAGNFDANAWYDWLMALPRPSCLFAVVPDVVADWRSTFDRFERYAWVVRRAELPVALVAQDGLTPRDLELHEAWDQIDCLFIGGSTEWKLSSQATDVARAAQYHGKWVHMGRVNSLRRLRAAQLMGCDSVDGTYVAFRARRERGLGERELGEWLEELERAPFLPIIS